MKITKTCCCTLELSQDGKTVYARLDGYAYTATWAGTTGGNLFDSANWTCVDGYGVTLPDALPCEYTRVIVCSSGCGPFVNTLNKPPAWAMTARKTTASILRRKGFSL